MKVGIMLQANARKINTKRAGAGRAALASYQYDGVRPQVTRTPLLVNGRSVSLHAAPDTVNVSLYYQVVDRGLLGVLADAKASLQLEPWSVESCSFEWGGAAWVLYRRGVSGYQYRLQQGDVVLCLSDRSAFDDKSGRLLSNMPTATLHIGSISSQLDCVGIFDNVVGWLNRCGLDVRVNKLSRIDLAVDCIGVALHESDLVQRNRWVTRARSSSEIVINYGGKGGDTVTGLRFGAGDLQLRVYNKVLEMQRKQDVAKQRVFSRLWGVAVSGDNAIPVTRVEYQLRGDVLRQFKKLRSFHSAMQGLMSIWAYCCNTWSRHCDSAVDREGRNQSRCNMSGLWSTISAVSWSNVIRDIRETVVVRRDPVSLVQQAVGCLKTATACVMDNIIDVQDGTQVLELGLDMIRRVLPSMFDGADMARRWSRDRVTIREDGLYNLRTGEHEWWYSCTV